MIVFYAYTVVVWEIYDINYSMQKRILQVGRYYNLQNSLLHTVFYKINVILQSAYIWFFKSKSMNGPYV